MPTGLGDAPEGDPADHSKQPGARTQNVGTAQVFRLRVLAEIEKEMQTWVEEFKGNLFQLEQQAESRLRAKAQSRQADLGDAGDYRQAKKDT